MIKDSDKKQYTTLPGLANLSGFRYSTLKYYTELAGILPYTQKEEGLIRRYHIKESIMRLKKIKKLKIERKTIPEIIEFFK